MILTFERAVELATKAHNGQVDKAGQPYITHPLRVMKRLDNEIDKIVAVLHDVLEDTDLSIEDLVAEGASEEIITTLKLLTKSNQTYDEYLWAIKNNPIALRVKLADIADNTDKDRIKLLDDAEKKRLLTKYEKAVQILTTKYYNVRNGLFLMKTENYFLEDGTKTFRYCRTIEPGVWVERTSLIDYFYGSCLDYDEISLEEARDVANKLYPGRSDSLFTV